MLEIDEVRSYTVLHCHTHGHGHTWSYTNAVDPEIARSRLIFCGLVQYHRKFNFFIK